ncbi:MAG: hypothetical protein WDA75_24275, partial [Candidatus Latescibacterota bacterium]|jgi:hypothetical protein
VVGTLMLFVVGFGWAKPVPVDFSRLRPLRGGLVLDLGLVSRWWLSAAAVPLLVVANYAAARLAVGLAEWGDGAPGSSVCSSPSSCWRCWGPRPNSAHRHSVLFAGWGILA